MFLIEFDEAKLERSLKEVPHAIHGPLRHLTFELNIFPKRCRLASLFVGLCYLVDFESLRESVGATLRQRESLALFVVKILIEPKEVVVLV